MKGLFLVILSLYEMLLFDLELPAYTVNACAVETG